MNRYEIWWALSIDDRDNAPDEIANLDGNTWEGKAENFESARQQARLFLRDKLRELGYNAKLSDTSEEVYAESEDGTEYVFYAFDEP